MQQKTEQQKSPFNNTAILRWCNISIRTLHIACAGVSLGGIIQQQPDAGSVGWYFALVLTGVILLLLEWLHDRHWPHRGKGLLVQCHTLLAAAAMLLPALSVVFIWLALILGSVGSHMPRRYRHWSIFYGPEKKEMGKRAENSG